MFKWCEFNRILGRRNRGELSQDEEMTLKIRFESALHKRLRTLNQQFSFVLDYLERQNEELLFSHSQNFWESQIDQVYPIGSKTGRRLKNKIRKLDNEHDLNAFRFEFIQTVKLQMKAIRQIKFMTDAGRTQSDIIERVHDAKTHQITQIISGKQVHRDPLFPSDVAEVIVSFIDTARVNVRQILERLDTEPYSI